MDDTIFPVTKDVAARALIDNENYQAMYAESIADPESFWNNHGKRIDWIKPYTKIK
ncbi:MAG: acetyl-coenzyme A synthetase N-terminal domain-containing protein, partial [Pseudomonadota bacterium]|nr:acetyl-coenzyme A synthetase N-terminal domain-containing protein [Pseudomonadota bacterium]